MLREKLFSLLLLAAFSVSPSLAAVRLPAVLGDHMVLQRERPIHLWGLSDPGESVSVSLNGSTQSATGDNQGHWSLYLPPLPAGGPFQIQIAASNHITLNDVLVGDVWFASGQSNMEMPLKGFAGSAVVKNSAEEIRQANLPTMRVLIVSRKASPYPVTDIETKNGWSLCTPQAAPDFSAVAYFFGRAIATEQHVPIGLIQSDWGGTPAEAWTSLEGIAADSSLMPVFAARAQQIGKQAGAIEAVEMEKKADALARSRNQPLPSRKWQPDLASWAPSWLFNGMVAPVLNYAIKGVIWYQGESNTAPDMASLYSRLFPAMIADWRSHWQLGDFPFLFVQISSFKSDNKGGWPLVRDAQRRTLSVTNTGMAVSIDVGDPKNVHPADKQTVGARLALVARALAYHENLEYSGPAFRQVSVNGDTLRAWFNHAEGLTAQGGSPTGFEIAGLDHRFFPATAHIEGDNVILTNASVSAPRFVRYGWADTPSVNLYNAAGLPASPFTSELVPGSPD